MTRWLRWRATRSTASDKGPHVSRTENKSAPLKRYSVGENTDAILETCWAHSERPEGEAVLLRKAEAASR